MGDITVRPARHEDVPAIDALRKREWYCVGFIPEGKYHEEIDGRGGTLLVAEINGALAGFLYATHGEHFTRIAQAAVWEDARRMDAATALIDAVQSKASQRGHFGMRCRVAEDIEANDFWQALGFEQVGQSWGRFLWKQAGPKARKVNVYERLTQSGLWVPAHGAALGLRTEVQGG